MLKCSSHSWWQSWVLRLTSSTTHSLQFTNGNDCLVWWYHTTLILSGCESSLTTTHIRFSVEMSAWMWVLTHDYPSQILSGNECSSACIVLSDNEECRVLICPISHPPWQIDDMAIMRSAVRPHPPIFSVSHSDSILVFVSYHSSYTKQHSCWWASCSSLLLLGWYELRLRRVGAVVCWWWGWSPISSCRNKPSENSQQPPILGGNDCSACILMVKLTSAAPLLSGGNECSACNLHSPHWQWGLTSSVAFERWARRIWWWCVMPTLKESDTDANASCW